MSFARILDCLNVALELFHFPWMHGYLVVVYFWLILHCYGLESGGNNREWGGIDVHRYKTPRRIRIRFLYWSEVKWNCQHEVGENPLSFRSTTKG